MLSSRCEVSAGGSRPRFGGRGRGWLGRGKGPPKTDRGRGHTVPRPDCGRAVEPRTESWWRDRRSRPLQGQRALLRAVDAKVEEFRPTASGTSQPRSAVRTRSAARDAISSGHRGRRSVAREGRVHVRGEAAPFDEGTRCVDGGERIEPTASYVA